jgi:hypothetical protein
MTHSVITEEEQLLHIIRFCYFKGYLLYGVYGIKQNFEHETVLLLS